MYDTSAAAEAAGYRACLRCRPYREPQPQSYAGPELVCRAVQSILDGALDGAGEAALGARLGISARHLRRLFAEHVGVTPDQLARSRRAHFARRLLDDTDLTITDIAFASGFGSVRQLNRACQEIFRASPGELRARRRRSDRLAADGGLLLRLPFRGPLDWDAMLAYFAARAIPGVEDVSDRTYRRTVVIEGDPGVLELSPGGHDHLLLRVHLPHWEGLIHLVQRARRIFSLDAPVDDIARDLARTPIIGGLMAARPGRRVPGTWDPFETGVRAVVGQQVTVVGATTIMGRLVAQFGNPVAGLDPLGLTHMFPSPQTLAAADLTSTGLTTARAHAINGFAAAVVAGAVPLDRSVPLDELIAAITAIPGLGPWTAHYLALRLGERDAFPGGDLGLQRARAQLAPDEPTSLDAVAAGWSPWRATAAAQLWMRSGEADVASSATFEGKELASAAR
jgi:AraC family transcriptional regulator of adaptative response / DNA-3-methyladenine glycosylase II